MDIALMAMGAGIAFWGWRLKSPDGTTQPSGTVMLGIGGLVAVIGLVIFIVAFVPAFVGGFNEGYQQGR